MANSYHGRRRTAFTVLNTAVLAPIPKASVRTTIAAKPNPHVNQELPEHHDDQMEDYIARERYPKYRLLEQVNVRMRCRFGRTRILHQLLDASIAQYYNQSRHKCNHDCAICNDAVRTDFGTMIRCRSSREGMFVGVVNFRRRGVLNVRRFSTKVPGGRGWDSRISGQTHGGSNYRSCASAAGAIHHGKSHGPA